MEPRALIPLRPHRGKGSRIHRSRGRHHQRREARRILQLPRRQTLYRDDNLLNKNRSWAVFVFSSYLLNQRAIGIRSGAERVMEDNVPATMPTSITSAKLRVVSAPK